MGLLFRSTLPAHRRATFARRRNNLYENTERFLAALSPKPGLEILISSSKPDWRDDIARGFHGTRHKIEFGPIQARSFDEFDLVVPLTIADLNRVNEWSCALSKNPIPVPSKSCIRLCNDKYEFSRVLVETGFGEYVPRTGMGAEFEPPFILKKRTGEWGMDCYFIRDHEDKKAVSDLLTNPDFFGQEMIRGHFEFATHILFAEGRVVKALNMMYEFQSDTPIKGRDQDLYKVIQRCPYLDLFSDVLKAIGFQGICCVNYKVANGRPYLLEINPRFGGSLGPYFFSFLRHLT